MSGTKVIPRRRGEPLLAMCAVLALWTMTRVATWETPFGPAFAAAVANAARAPTLPPAQRFGIAPAAPSPRADGVLSEPFVKRPSRALEASSAKAGWPKSAVGAAFGPTTHAAAPLAASAPSAGPVPLDPRTQSIADASQTATTALSRKRWRVDGWLGWRPGSTAGRVAAGGPAAPAYGASQGGLIAQFDLGAGRFAPATYLRTTWAPGRPQQGDVALGLSARPVGGIPVRVHAEARATRIAGDTQWRPAAFVVGAPPPIDLPGDLRAEGYGQAGWVGGRFATPFVDAQARVDRPLLSAGPAEVRIGAGAWGGAQQFASRLDVGPSLSLGLPEAQVPLRLSVDYRFRVAGNARPGDGVALTLSTGF